MSWIKTNFLTLALYFALAGSAVSGDNPRRVIVPPAVESKIGYVSFEKDTGLQPELKKIFIAPQTRLPIMLDSTEFYLLMVRMQDHSVCCMIPKYQKYMVLMEPSKDNLFMYFRGGIEADLVPFTVMAYEELPVTASSEKSYSATVKRNGISTTIEVPRDTPGLLFSRESAFAKFAEEQKGKGLEYLNGSWMSSDKALSLRNSQSDKEKKKKERWNTLKAQAEAGVLVLKDGRILHGSYKGCDRVSVIFETESVSGQYGVDDIADVSLEKALSMGNLDSAEKLLAKAEDLAKGYPGQAKQNLEQVQSLLRKVSPSATDLMEKGMRLGAEASKLNSDMDKSLADKNQEIYNNQVFQKDVLAYHLKCGHMLIGGGTWINPDQICRRCSGYGEIACAKCQSTGKFASKCAKCQGGRITCHICEGSGFRTCNACNGMGEFVRTCTYCGGSGVVSGYYSYPCGPNVYLFSGAVMVVGRCCPWYYYPCYTTKTCPSCNGSGKTETACTYCGGYGKMVCPRTEKCSLCNGTGFVKGMCPDCEGRGKITCPDCKGKGFTGQPQAFPKEDTPAPSQQNLGGGKSPSRMP